MSALGTFIHFSRREMVDALIEDPDLAERMRADYSKVFRALAREVCICAAVRLADGCIIRGHRHHDCLRTALERKRVLGLHDGVRWSGEQGFVTSNNRFVTREQGYRLQVSAGIESKAPGGYRGERLYSEDLY